MAVYNLSGNSLSAIYGILGDALLIAYDIDGNEIFTNDNWYSEITVNKYRTADTNYYVVRIPQTRVNEQKQYPFVYVPNGTSAGTESAIDVAVNDGFYATINAGVFHASTKLLDGITIENAEVLYNIPTTEHPTNPQAARPLTIDSTGNLSYTEYDADGYDLVDDGIVSCVSGFMPIVVDGVTKTDWINLWSMWATSDAQRQILGQFANGDYAIITIEGRNFDDSVGLTVYQTADLCISLGLEFAYMLDGGGSTETVIGNEQINTIYEGTYGRLVPSFIVFNGTDEFFVPNA